MNLDSFRDSISSDDFSIQSREDSIDSCLIFMGDFVGEVMGDFVGDLVGDDTSFHVSSRHKVIFFFFIIIVFFIMNEKKNNSHVRQFNIFLSFFTLDF